MSSRNLKRFVKTTFADFVKLGPEFAVGALLSRIGRGTAVVNLPGQGKFTIRRQDNDCEVLRQIFVSREYGLKIGAVQQRIDRYYQQLLKDNRVPIIIDAGANIGAASRWFAAKYPEALILAIEPEEKNFDLLQRNVAQYPKIRPIFSAIGSSAGFVQVITKDAGWSSQTERAENGCRIVTIPELIQGVDRGVALIVKIDVEGFEEDLFQQNTDWIDASYAVFIEPHDWKFPDRHTSRFFQEQLGSRQFQLFISGENLLYVRQSAPDVGVAPITHTRVEQVNQAYPVIESAI